MCPARAHFGRWSKLVILIRTGQNWLGDIVLVKIWSNLVIFDPRSKMTKNEPFWLIFRQGVGPGPCLIFEAIFGLKNRKVLRNVVFGIWAAKMAQKQHIGNFQI